MTREINGTKIEKERMFILGRGAMMKATVKRIAVRCPHCGQRLLDVIQTDEALGDCVLETKCQRCRKVLTVKVSLNGKNPQGHSRDSVSY